MSIERGTYRRQQIQFNEGPVILFYVIKYHPHSENK